jgi:hypothetical protein
MALHHRRSLRTHLRRDRGAFRRPRVASPAMFSLLRKFVRAFWSSFTSRRDLALQSSGVKGHQSWDVLTCRGRCRPVSVCLADAPDNAEVTPLLRLVRIPRPPRRLAVPVGRVITAESLVGILGRREDQDHPRWAVGFWLDVGPLDRLGARVAFDTERASRRSLRPQQSLTPSWVHNRLVSLKHSSARTELRRSGTSRWSTNSTSPSDRRDLDAG